MTIFIPQVDHSGRAFSSTIESLCCWRCRFCSRPYTSWGSLAGHMREAHGSNVGTKEVMRECLVRAVHFRCPLCRQEMLCDRAVISSHAHSKHMIGMPGMGFLLILFPF